MKHIKQAMIAMATGKIRAYQALQNVAIEIGDEEEAAHLQKMIDEWTKVLTDLLVD